MREIESSYVDFQRETFVQLFQGRMACICLTRGTLLEESEGHI